MSDISFSFPTSFPTTGMAAFPTGAVLSGDGGIGSMSEFGCPLSAFVSLESICSADNVPSCAAAQFTGTADPASITYDAACCTSLSSYGESIASCYSKNAPTCLDTSALLASATEAAPTDTDLATASFSNPCAQYFGGKAGGGNNVAATPAASGQGGNSGSATATGSAGSATGSASAAGGSSKPNAASGHGVGLKVWIGVVAMGAVGVLAL